MTNNDDDVLNIQGYSGGFRRSGRLTPVLDDVTFSVRRGRMTAVIGETGSGKSLTALSVLGLQPATFQRTGGRILFEGVDLLTQSEAELQKIRGRRISMVFQDARAALNPVLTIGRQLGDVCRVHQDVDRRRAREQVAQMLERVRIPDPLRRMKQYPHEFSGGMAQRVMIAMALICRPRLLILDEPTTGLDVTIQSEIMELILELSRESALTSCLITHDLGVVAETCDDAVVMRRGTVVETASCADLFRAPRDPYTQQLLAASRSLEVR